MKGIKKDTFLLEVLALVQRELPLGRGRNTVAELPLCMF